ncbi:unnamed protein product (macronuclear) [Paramecium tetraurelia]|uniref:Uncharacterized protein n=1 Tax=Paramecium tetraurelia TaxID=5888 RepID=A0DQP6_PARTE|nr:uncharacterized protein GSPATT00002763001 [Paramecium tetraurelia]CAK85363.1 unnamed protein product [Paramecium tetraurelia]|eukprot:XP_001452760.1 hypothetical protein (macronuclear) [Paramecium tetraurelia strain d4-2]
MGSACDSRIITPSKDFDLEEINFGKTYIYGPPSILKPQPIQILKFSDDEINYQQEKEFQSHPQKDYSEESAVVFIPSGNLRPFEKKLSVDEALILKEIPEQQEQNSISRNMKNSNQDIVQYKSILKHKSTNTLNTSYPQSPQHHFKESQTSSSQNSIKKVTFEKKQRVVYSSFRRIKN